MTGAVLSSAEGSAAHYPRLAFIHIPKTAGTSVTTAVSRAYAGATLPAMTTLDYQCYTDDQLQSYRFFRGHAYRADYRRLPPGTQRFTILRDPVARATSYYNFFRQLDESGIADKFILEASHIAKTASPIEYIYSDSPFIIEQIRLGQLRQFLSPATLSEVAHRQFLSRALRNSVVADFATELAAFDFALTAEMLPLTFPLMVAKLGLPADCFNLPHTNASSPTESYDSFDIRRALIDVSAADFECYERVRRREVQFATAALADAGCRPVRRAA